MSEKTYELIEENTGIVCLSCGNVSYIREDVRRRYCSRCNVFHDGEQENKEEKKETKPLIPKEKKVVPAAIAMGIKFRTNRGGSNFTRRRLY